MNSISKILAGMAVLFAAWSAGAQPLNQARVTVPFSFHAGSQELPAGEYEIAIKDGSDVVVLSTHGRVRGMLLATRGGAAIEERSFLGFRRQAGQWFLENVAVAGVLEQFTVRKLNRELLTEEKSAGGVPFAASSR